MTFDDRLRALFDARDDDAVWETYGETWCIMSTDLCGFSRGVAEHGIIHFLRIIHESERLHVPIIERHRGELLKVEGDSLFVIFANVQDALHAAIEMQRATRRWNEGKLPHDQMLLGIGLGYGRVIRVGPEDVYGNEVNSACVLGENYAGGYEILVTQAVRDQARDLTFEPFPNVPPGARGAYRLVTS